jgi:hypothetical protein
MLHGENKVKFNNNLFKVFHQHIRGLKNKIPQLIDSVYSILPHILCITEHHMKEFEINMVSLGHYKLAAKFCRQYYKNGGTSIY